MAADGDVDGVWYADDDARHEYEQDGQLGSFLITPYNSDLWTPAIIRNLHVTISFSCLFPLTGLSPFSPSLPSPTAFAHVTDRVPAKQ